jgi:prevent-host-death family protein
MAKTITATELRKRIREVIQGAQFQGEHIIVTVFNKPAVAIISMHDYNKYLERKEQQIQSKAVAKRRSQEYGKQRGSKHPQG